MSATGLLYLTWFAIWIAASVVIGGIHTLIVRRLNRHQPTPPVHRQSRHVRVVPDPTVTRHLARLHDVSNEGARQ